MVLRFTGTLVVIFAALGVVGGRLSLPGAAICTALGLIMVVTGDRR